MEWKIVINEEDKFVEVTTSGIADKDSSLAIINFLLAALGQDGRIN